MESSRRNWQIDMQPQVSEEIDEQEEADSVRHNIDSDLKQLEKEKDRRKRQKRKRFIGYVRSRKLKRKLKSSKSAAADEQVINPANIDAMNVVNIPKSEVPYKKYRNAMLEIMSQNEILEHRTRVNRRTSRPFDNSVTRRQTRSASPKKSMSIMLKKEQIDNNSTVQQLRVAKNDVETPVGVHGRNKRRINYSEELVDEAFMYEQILQDKQHQQEKRKRSLSKLSQQSTDGSMASAPTIASGNLDSRLRLLEQRNEISIMPVKSRLMAKENHTDAKASKPIKAEPLFNITSSVSVHIKPRKSEPSTSLQISNITSLHGGREMPPKKRRKLSCEYCQEISSDEKQLAIHKLVHMKISAYKFDTKRVLHPKLRRVSNKIIKYYFLQVPNKYGKIVISGSYVEC